MQIEYIDVIQGETLILKDIVLEGYDELGEDIEIEAEIKNRQKSSNTYKLLDTVKGSIEEDGTGTIIIPSRLTNRFVKDVVIIISIITDKFVAKKIVKVSTVIY